MRAIDTNVVVRYLTGDGADQAARARAAIDEDDVFVSTTVLLESEWVLRSVYGFGSEDVVAALRAFAGLPTVLVESPVLLAEALERADLGMDFADALHLGAAGHCDVLLTFDTGFIEAARDEPVEVVES
ncbi:MAG: type II toxin-antitoxin system VapC family toxin [Gammaproteobacteria bacterium]|nr:type II toxin-antitoxin system VapC family toxin [Gammaproteobacteria bacterium]